MTGIANWKTPLEGEEILAIHIEGVLFKKESICAALEKLDHDFDCGYGGHEGISFWAWTDKDVIFCGVYDGSEWLERIPRKPSKGSPQHVGDE